MVRWFTWAGWMWLLVYLAVMGAVVIALFQARQSALVTFGGGEAKANWNAWREAAQENSGGVQRRVTRSQEPPALVLMRDYFERCLALALILASALFCTTAYFVRGMFHSARTVANIETHDRAQE